MIDLNELSNVNDDDWFAHLPLPDMKQPTTIWSKISCTTTHRRKRMCIIFGIITIIFIVLAVTISTPIIIMGKEHSTNTTTSESTRTTIGKLSTTTEAEATSGAKTTKGINPNTTWSQYGTTIAGGNERGSRLDQLSDPSDIYVSNDQTVYVLDGRNHRIVEWKNGATSGKITAGGRQGDENDQLGGATDMIVDHTSNSVIICDYENRRVMRWPLQNGITGEVLISNIDCYGLAMDNDGYLYVSEEENHLVQRWFMGHTAGIVVAGEKGQGSKLDQFNHPTFIFIDENHSLYVSDVYNHRVMKWIKGAKIGVIVAGGHGEGSQVTQLSEALGIAVDPTGAVYVADSRNHRVMRWSKGAVQGYVVVGGKGNGNGSDQLSSPSSLAFDQYYNLYTTDHGNNRVQKFNIKISSNV